MPKTNEISSRRTFIVKVTLTAPEQAMLSRAAEKAGIPLSIYVRAAALEKAQGRV